MSTTTDLLKSPAAPVSQTTRQAPGTTVDEEEKQRRDHKGQAPATGTNEIHRPPPNSVLTE